MKYRDLREFLSQLESRGELRRVAEPVSPHLEMTALSDRVLRAEVLQGPSSALWNERGPPKGEREGDGVLLVSSFDSVGDRGREQGRESTGRKGKERKGKERKGKEGKERKGEIEREGERVVMKEEREGGKESQERGSLAGGKERRGRFPFTHTSRPPSPSRLFCCR